ncbi:MAG: NAD(P)-binding domain-containing protein [Deltaproteobacteria bacterium]|nr:NAD(P)-binding domain-containing protein [Deltaproteobacteria bacterium]
MAVADILKVSFEFSPKVGTRQLPALTEHYESITVPGLYIGGDLADAPIIKIALNQGYEVIQKIFKKDFQGKAPARGEGDAEPGVAYRKNQDKPERYDVAIVGAGPAGIGAAIACQDLGLTYVLLEKEKPFNTIQNYPKAKHVFSEPREIKLLPNVFKFDDELKENLVDRWEKLIDSQGFHLLQPVEVTSIARADAEAFNVTGKGPDGERKLRARKVFLAIGRRGNVNRMTCPGAELDKVEYVLHEPGRFKGKRVMVVGGGDSAVEAAMACAEAGAKVTVSYRQESFARAKAGNRQKIEKMIAAGEIAAEFNTSTAEVTVDAVKLKSKDGTKDVPNDYVLAFLGASLPTEFLKKIGVQMEGDMSRLRALWITTFALLTYLFYCVKAHKDFFPFGPLRVLWYGDYTENNEAAHGFFWKPVLENFKPLAGVYDRLQHLHLPFWGIHNVHDEMVWGFYWRDISGSFLGTLAYSFLVTYFGLQAMKRYPSPIQKRRYKIIIFSQLALLFAIPELLAPIFFARGYKWYSIVVPWPLSKWSVLDSPEWEPTHTAWLGLSPWVWIGGAVALVGMPLFVRYQGERFCSYLCGCGALAETFGDRWRHLAPRGRTAKQAELFGRFVLGAAVVTTLFMLADLYQNVSGFRQLWAVVGPHDKLRVFVNEWYDLIVDFWMAAVIGVAAYPYLGNRFWCRFMCPLRAFMEITSKWIGRLKITSNNKCIGCGQCTRYCQMGIDVQRFAQTQKDMHNENSACIQCGICVQVCPMEVLTVERAPQSARRRLPLYKG